MPAEEASYYPSLTATIKYTVQIAEYLTSAVQNIPTIQTRKNHINGDQNTMI
jgi:hypothetical protein